ncbi:MAG: hypothetical protein OHK0013_09520 [Sandaracinaceae bacterium]
MAEDEQDDEERARDRDLGIRSALQAGATLAGTIATYGILFAPVFPVVAAVSAGAMLTAAGVAVGSGTLAPGRAVRDARVVRSLRRHPSLEGVVVPLTMVTSPEGDCCAFDHVVHRCEACACVRPCTWRGGRFRWEERLAGRFLVRAEDRVVFVDRADVHFETTLRERLTSRFVRLDGGERVRVYADLVELTELPDDVGAVLASHRALPRVVAPATGTAVLVEKLDRA